MYNFNHTTEITEHKMKEHKTETHKNTLLQEELHTSKKENCLLDNKRFLEIADFV
jgi:hypothetical protein